MHRCYELYYVHAYISNCSQCHINKVLYFNYTGSLSTEVAVAITFVITFILTLIIATVITAIITYICVKRKFERIFKDKEQSKTVLYEQVGPCP